MQLQKSLNVGRWSTRGYVQSFPTVISIASPLDRHVVEYANHPLKGPLMLVYVNSKWGLRRIVYSLKDSMCFKILYVLNKIN